jgi:diguanylate cyclase
MANETNSNSETEEYENALSLAKEALAYIGMFRTPPTPEVFEVWFRYSEGKNQAINEQLSHAVKVTKSVNKKQLHDLRLQFLNPVDSSEANAKVSQQLALEINSLRTLIESQEDANEKFGGSIELVNTRLESDSVTPSDLRECLTSLQIGTESIQRQMADMGNKLKLSKNQIEGLQATVSELHKEVHTDPLTGVGNRRLFDKMIATSIDAKASDTSPYLILIDLDKFKDINDTHGHSTGDDVLRFVASSLKKHSEEATVTRYGGDEFAMFVCLEPEQALLFSDELCRFFHSTDLTVRRSGEQLGALTISVGAARLRPDDDSKSWFERADRLLYSSKSAGRNRAMVERKHEHHD